MKQIRTAADLAINGAPPAFDAPIHVGRPNIGDRATFLERVNQILDNRWLTNNGPMVRELEQRIAGMTGVRHCVAMCNATIALEIAIRALDLTAAILACLPINSFIVENEAGLRACWEAGKIPILAPRRFLRDLDDAPGPPLPEGWEVTSDSIAARIADRLGADRLILLKSANLRAGLSRTEAAAAGLVDPHFPIAARRLENVAYRNLRDHVGEIITLSGDE